jgi:hypothetical protein
MDRWSVVLVALVLALVGACGSKTVTLGESWHQVEFEPREVMPPPLVIGFERGAWRFNNVLLSKAEILEAIRKAAPLVPRPRVFLRFARNDFDQAHSMAKEIQGVGGCDDVGCLFKVTGP